MLSILKRADYQELMLPFKYVHSEEDDEKGIIGIVAFGDILEEMKYCYACYMLKDCEMYENGDYEQIINLLKNYNENKLVKVKIKFKNKQAKDFVIDLNSLDEVYKDKRFNKLYLLGWGFNNEDILNNSDI